MSPEAEKRLQELHTALVGNEQFGQPGLVQIVQDLLEREKALGNRVRKIEILIDRGKWAFIGAFLLGGFGGTMALDYLLKLV